jgi:NitT/TauT family transport system substrate-binding protein
MSRLLALLFAAAGMLGVVQEPAAAQEKITLALNWIPNGNHFGIFMAQAKGYYREAKLDVDIQRGFGSGDTAKRVGTGTADFGIADAASVIAGRAGGLKIKQIASIFDKSADAIFFLDGGPIKGPKDLEGHKLGATAGETTLNLMPVFAANAGFDSAKVEIVNIAASAKYASLVAKSVDAIVGFTNEEPAIRNVAAKANLTLKRFLFSDYGVDYYSIGIIASDETLAKRGDMVKRFLAATLRGYADTIKDPAAAADVFAKAHPESSRDVALSQWKVAEQHIVTERTRKNGLGFIDKAKMTQTLDLIKRFQTVPGSMQVDDIYSADYLTKVAVP